MVKREMNTKESIAPMTPKVNDIQMLPYYETVFLHITILFPQVDANSNLTMLFINQYVNYRFFASSSDKR